MKLDCSVVEGEVKVALGGNLYSEDAQFFKDKLLTYLNKGHKRFAIDMSEVAYMDDSGLGAFITVHRRAEANGGGITVKGLRGLAKELFVAAQLQMVFPVG
ncbi:MAG: rsbV [Firmicutes bacterium]|nr:rsbV [Bacillota bacterium]